VQPQRSTVEMIGGADVIGMLAAQHHHVDLLWGHLDVAEAGQKMRVIGRQADIDQDRPLAASHQIGIRGAVLETDLIEIIGGLDQRTYIAIEQGLERARPAVAHEFAAGR